MPNYMSKISTDAATALLHGNPFNRGNTKVKVYDDGSREMLLHGNCIAFITYDNRLFISSCGWTTATTKSRLNALPKVRIQQRQYMWFLNGDYWTGVTTEIPKWHNFYSMYKWD